MKHDDSDIELKFDGKPIKQLGGAPADAVINALTALQRLVHLIGMKSEGRVFGQRAKPSSKVRKDFAVICKASEIGSHVQPFTIGSLVGDPSSFFAREELLKTLKAFDSGEIDIVEQIIPDARERWFIADAAAGLIPPEESGIEITVRPGAHGPFSFKAERARSLIEQLRSGKPPRAGIRNISGKLRAVDYANNFVTIQPSGQRAFRINYPHNLELMLQANPRKKIVISGIPDIDSSGYITGFDRMDYIAELDENIAQIDCFLSGGTKVVALKPLKILAKFDFEDRLYIYQDQVLGVDAWAEHYQGLRDAIVSELDVLWRNYALADDEELDEDAIQLKLNLNRRFRAE